MKVILSHDILGIGHRGEVKEVANGYARNFLFPKSLARLATETALKDLVSRAKQYKKRMEHELKDTQKLAHNLDGAEVEVKEKANAGGTLYGALDETAVAAAVRDQLKTVIDPKQVRLHAPIKSLGEHRVIIEFGHGLEAEVTVLVSEK